LGAEVRFLWHKDSDISAFSTQDCIVLPGGFSYGDYLRCGAIARFSPMMKSVIEFANQGGKVLGVCNGFQILCESGLLPGVLLQNMNRQFICKNVYIKSASGEALKIPIAHGEGRYHADGPLLDELEANGQVIFRYCDAAGSVTAAANAFSIFNFIKESDFDSTLTKFNYIKIIKIIIFMFAVYLGVRVCSNKDFNLCILIVYYNHHFG
jgi:phosphoribosylformylglycinamidine synthase